MNKKHIPIMSMRCFSVISSLFFLIFILCMSFSGYLFNNLVAAQGSDPKFVFYYNSDDPAAVQNLINEIKDGRNRDGSAKAATKILVKNGPAGDMVMDYDLDTTNKLNVQGGAARDDEGEYYWSTKLYCSIQTRNITATKPTGNRPYIEMLYVVGIKIDWGDDAEKAIKDYELYDGGAGAEQAVRVIPSTGGGEDARNELFDHRNHSVGVKDLGDGDGEIDPSGCRPRAMDMKVHNYGKLSTREKNEWADLVNKAGEGASDGGGGPPVEEVDCDTTWSSPLSWIACPLIDMGVGMTDGVFKNIIQPMLETVPVTADPEDGAYKAWQQFRLLANVLLVGSLLVIVYSQAKGPK